MQLSGAFLEGCVGSGELSKQGSSCIDKSLGNQLEV